MSELTRRAAGKLLLALPAVLSLDETKQPPSELSEFIASHEPGLSDEERERLRKGLASQDKALAVVRGFKLSRNVDPCLRFRPLRSKRG